LKWLKDLGKISSDNPKTVRREARDSRHFWDKKMEHVKSKIKEFEAYIQNRNIRGYF
jgi:alpha/beta superfamily hydrolase